MTDIKINIKKQVIPVKIGEVELCFDDSLEGFTKFFAAEKKLKENDLRIAEKLKRYSDIPESDLDKTAANEILELKKESVSAFYDEFFGEGSFNKIYEKYPDVEQIEDIIVPISKSVSSAAIKRREERSKQAESALNEIDKKREKKK